MAKWLLFCVMLSMTLGACDTTRKVEVYEKPVLTAPYVPAHMRDCKALPQVPGEGARQRDVATYVTDLHAVAVECSTKLDTVDQILKQNERRVAAQNAIADAEAEKASR